MDHPLAPRDTGSDRVLCPHCGEPLVERDGRCIECGGETQRRTVGDHLPGCGVRIGSGGWGCLVGLAISAAIALSAFPETRAFMGWVLAACCGLPAIALTAFAAWQWWRWRRLIRLLDQARRQARR